MAHVGTIYPRSAFMDLRMGDGVGNYYYWPARKNWFKVRSPHGSLMTKWNGYDSLSEVGQRVGTNIEWICRHPTVTTDDPYFLLRWVGKNWFTDFFTMRWEVEYWEQGTKWGWIRSPGGEGEGIYFGGLTYNISNVGQPWQNLVNSAMFNDVGFTNVNSGVLVANWADQPDYHPYRTRP